MQVEWEAPFAVDPRAMLSVYRHGAGDPTYRVDPAGGVWLTCLTPNGPATLHLASAGAAGASAGAAGAVVTARAWGAGAACGLAAVPAQLGADDDLSDFAAMMRADAGIVGELARLHPGVPRIGRSGRVFEALVPAVLEQKVVGAEAHRAWRSLLYKYGSAAPGPAPGGMRVFPPPQVWARIPSWDWHRAGVEGVRARTIMNAARVAARLEEITSLPHAEADRRLRSLPGIGVWTSAEIRQRATADPDALSVGDYNLPKAVGWTLAAQRDTDDEGMLKLLAPYQGQRYRVQRLIERGGSAQPRHGPRLPVRDYRVF